MILCQTEVYRGSGCSAPHYVWRPALVIAEYTPHPHFWAAHMLLSELQIRTDRLTFFLENVYRMRNP